RGIKMVSNSSCNFSASPRLCDSAFNGVRQAVQFGLMIGLMLSRVSVAELPTPTLKSPFVAVDLREGESEEVTLTNGQKVAVKLITVQDFRDSLRGAVRRSEVKVEVGGQTVTLGSATYHLPMTVGNVQIDCPITK